MSKLINLKIILVILAATALVACANKKDNYKGMSAEAIYAKAQNNVKKDNYVEAAKDFEALEARYPYGAYSDKAQIGLIHAYYKRSEPALAIAAADRFIRMNPRHPEIDYVYYLKGMVNFEQNTTFMYKYLPLDRSARDPSRAEESVETFQTLVELFPNSKHAMDARKRIHILRNQLARHELGVVEYYMKRDAYLSAANRANYIVRHYPETTAVPEALADMVKAYRELKMTSLAEDTLATLQKNYPHSEALRKL